MPDIHGEYETDVERADIALEPQWFPAVENRGEGVFVQVDADAIAEWLQRPAVQPRRRGSWTAVATVSERFFGSAVTRSAATPSWMWTLYRHACRAGGRRVCRRRVVPDARAMSRMQRVLETPLESF